MAACGNLRRRRPRCGVEHDLVVMLAGVQTIEIGDAINTQQDSLAIDHERIIPDRISPRVIFRGR